MAFTAEALQLAVELSDLYFPQKRQPANALGLIDEAGSRAYMEASVLPPQYRDLERRIQQVRASKEKQIRNQSYADAAALRAQEKSLQDDLQQVLSKWQEQTGQRRGTIDEKAISRIVSELTGVEEEKVWKREATPPRSSGAEVSGAPLRVPKFEQVQTESVLHGYGVEIERGTGFVLLPHTDEFTGIFEYAITPAMEANGIVVKKAEDIYQPGPILEQVWERIRKAEVIVADLSGKNANVIYELGLCYGIQRCPILLVRDPAELPFSLRNLRYIEYGDSAEGTANLKRRLTATIEEFLAAVRTIQNQTGSARNTPHRSPAKERKKFKNKLGRPIADVAERSLLPNLTLAQDEQLQQRLQQLQQLQQSAGLVEPIASHAGLRPLVEIAEELKQFDPEKRESVIRRLRELLRSLRP